MDLEKSLVKNLNCLKNLAFDYKSSKGKRNNEVELVARFMNPFAADSTKISCSKAYRLLADKTQVYSLPLSGYVRNRATHTEEVVSFSIRAAEILGLNTWLCAAIAKGHDIGHSPFGHLGESFISQKTGRKFNHRIASVMLADQIERTGSGLNLCYETLEGIFYHGINSKEKLEGLPQEYAIVMIGDKISYTLSDLNDAIRSKTIAEKDIPEAATFLGNLQRVREEKCLVALAKESAEAGKVSFEKSDEAKAIFELRDWLFENVYLPSNKEILKIQLEEAWNSISRIEEFSEYDPALIFLHLTDKEVIKLANLAMQLIKPSKESTSWLTVWEVLPFLKKNVLYNFGEFSLNPDDFHPL